MIDAHFHIWQLARADYGWLQPQLGAIYRDISLDDWRTVSRPCGVTAGVLVQAAPTDAETRFLLQQAQRADDVLGVVGWVDMLAHDAPARIHELAAHAKLKGLRPMLQDIADPDWILQDALRPALEAMVDCELVFDALVKPVHLARIASLAERFPALNVVIDHGAKPDIANRRWGGWAHALARLASCPRVACKLSGLWNEAAPAADVAVLEPYIRHVMACFGSGRVLWGSDWPVLECAGTYARWHQAVRDLVALPQQRNLFDATARRLYRL